MAKKESVETMEMDNFSKVMSGKVLIKPIIREGQWLVKGHSGNWMYDNTKMPLVVPLDINTGALKAIFNESTEKDLRLHVERELGLEEGSLAPFNEKGKKYLGNYRVWIQKSEDIVSDNTVLLTLDLSNPANYLDYRILMLYTPRIRGLIAPSWRERFDSGTYKMAMVKESEKHNETVTRAELNLKAYEYLRNIQGSEEKLHNTLAIYLLSKKSGKLVPSNVSKEFYLSEIQSIIESDIKGFVQFIVDDKDNLETKALIVNALKQNVIKFSISRGFETMDGIPFGMSLNQAVAFLDNVANQEHLLMIQNQVELTK